MSLPFSSPLRAAPPGMPVGSSKPTFADAYERHLVGALFAPWAEQLLDRVSLPHSARVLDVACGTGIVARLVRRRMAGRGHVVGVDLSPAMIATARALEPAIEWREGSADRLPVRKDEHFDAVFCQQGLQFFPDRPAAVREMRRVLAPGGRLAVAVWRSVEENGLFHQLGAIAERFLGPVTDLRHSFADVDALASLLRDAGFDDVRVQSVSIDVRFECDPTVLAYMNAYAMTGMSARGKTLSEAERAALATEITEASLAETERYTTEGALTFPTSANVALART